MTERFFIDTLDQLKALSDPLRQRILAAMCCQPATARQIAKQLGTKPTRLYHHIELLENAGLIEVVDTRRKRGTIERYYQTTASQFVVDQKLLHVAEPGSDVPADPQAVLVDALQVCIAEARDAFDTERQATTPETSLVSCAHLHLTTAQAQVLAGKLHEWLNECCSLEACCDDAPSSDPAPYALTVALFPVRGASSE